MGFEQFGVVSFTSQAKVSPFIEYLEKGLLAETRCRSCGAFYFPPRADCCRCLSSEMEWTEITGPGRLISFSKLIYAPTGFEADLPYTIALVEFPNQAKVFGRLSKEMKEQEIEIGMKLKYEVVKLPNSRLLYEFKKA